MARELERKFENEDEGIKFLRKEEDKKLADELKRNLMSSMLLDLPNTRPQ